jgi:MFS transporter, DHA3 family, macrolide efflux protein
VTPRTAARAAGRRVLGANSPAAVPAFRRLVLAHGLNVLGYWVYLTAVFTRVTDELGGGTTQTSRIIAVATIPLLLFAPFTGLLIDRFGPKRALLSAYGVASAILTLASFSDSFAGFYLAALCIAFVVALLRPAVFGMLSRTVPPGLIAQGNGVLFAAGEAGIVVGPLLSQVVIRTLGTDAAFLLAGGSLATAALVLRSVPGPPPIPEERAAGWRARVAEIGAGARTVAKDRSSLVAMLCVVTLFMFIGSLISLEPSLISDEVGAERSLGWVYAAAGVGSCTSSLLVARRSYPARPLPRVGVALIALGLTTAGYATAPTLAAAIGWNFAVGFAFGWVMAPAITIVQQRSPAVVIGRTMAAVTIAQQASQGVAALLVGGLAEGQVRAAVATIGAFCVVVGALVAVATWRRVEPPAPPGSPLARGDDVDLTADTVPEIAGTPA